MHTFIGYSLDEKIRYKATSGGVGSSVLEFLFKKKIIQSALSFSFDQKTLKFIPKIIYSFDQYEISSSIYQEIDLQKFIRANVDKIKGTFACFALPCQSRFIRGFLKMNNHSTFIIGLTCSSQQSIEATYFLLKYLKIRKENVVSLSYRGNGWPSGIQILLKDKTTRFISNNKSIWPSIFHSRIFILPRCFRCKNTLNTYSDISIADPWLKEYTNKEKIGKTLIIANNEDSLKLLEDMYEEKVISLNKISSDLVFKSQQSTIDRKKIYFKYKKLFSFIRKIIQSSLYVFFITNNRYFFKLHCFLIHKLESFLIKINKIKI